ncbi:MAG: cyclodeaminase/cyclohydrolase family protein [Peptostreptococcaceae bacterium]|nr:cyclodeaminase/cyclohydrolase family protein [Peptostreptococcaceae bacterium]
MSVKVENGTLVFEEVVYPPLVEPVSENIVSLQTTSVENFISLLASKLPAPGGGGAAALSAAQGFALASMVCNLTIGKKKFAEFEERLCEIRRISSEKANRMLKLIDLDEEYFLPLSRAYGLPSETQEQKAEKKKIMDEALVTACLVPIETIKTSYEALLMLHELMNKSSKLVMSDVGVAAESFRAAIESAKLNVLINLRLLSESPIKDDLAKQLKIVGNEYPKIYSEVMSYVLETITLD